MKKKLAIVLSLILILGMAMQANAAEKAVGVLADCYIGISCKSNGVGIEFDTFSTTTADEIGCKDIVLQEKVNGSWRNITINGGSESNSSSYGASAVYTGAVKGRTYRAYCTHYAKYGSTTKTLYNETGEMVYN